MIPLKLTLEGFLSYRDETVVDFSEIEVACISGPNGAGKSTLFDAITWALFGKARRNDDDALINDALKKNDKGG
jgi:exonuclease SbcC